MPNGDPRRVRVLVLIKCLGHGGAEQLLVATMASRDRERFDYEVAFVLDAKDALVPAVEASGVPVHRLGAGGNGDLRWLPRLRRLLATGDFDVLHLHLPYAAAWGRLVAASLLPSRRPVIIYTEHSLWARTAAPVRALNRMTERLDRRVIAVSEAVMDALPPPARSRAQVIVHGIDLEAARSAATGRHTVRSELGVEDDEILVVTVANLRREKGIDVLLEAAHRLRSEGAAVKFALAGSGPLEEEVRTLHGQLGLGDALLLLGGRGDAVRLIAGADIFALASRHEGLPVTVMEAVTVGTPIVATAVGELPRLLTDGVDARLVPPDDPGLLAAAIGQLAADPAARERLAHNAGKLSSLFDIRLATAAIEALYLEVVTR